jgi:hypothetical protein
VRVLEQQQDITDIIAEPGTDQGVLQLQGGLVVDLPEPGDSQSAERINVSDYTGAHCGLTRFPCNGCL